jgi:hypothetical protein
MQEHFSAGAWMAQQGETKERFRLRRGWRVRRKCRSIFRRVPGWLNKVKRKSVFGCGEAGVYAENAGAFFGGCLNASTS